MKIHHLLHRFVNCKLSDVGLTAKGGLLSDLCKLLTSPDTSQRAISSPASPGQHSGGIPSCKRHLRFRVFHFNFYHTLNGCMYRWLNVLISSVL